MYENGRTNEASFGRLSCRTFDTALQFFVGYGTAERATVRVLYGTVSYRYVIALLLPDDGQDEGFEFLHAVTPTLI